MLSIIRDPQASTARYRALVYFGTELVELSADLPSGAEPRRVVTAYRSPIKSALLADMDGDGYAERLVQLQPAEPMTFLGEQFTGPIAENSPLLAPGVRALDLVPRVERCYGSRQGYQNCATLPIARGAAGPGTGSLGYEYRVAAPILAVTRVSPGPDDAGGMSQLDAHYPEIVVASTGAGRGGADLQSIFAAREISVMSLGGDIRNLPRSSSMLAEIGESNPNSGYNGGEGPPQVVEVVGGTTGSFWPDAGRLADIAVVTSAGEVIFAKNGFMDPGPQDFMLEGGNFVASSDLPDR